MGQPGAPVYLESGCDWYLGSHSDSATICVLCAHTSLGKGSVLSL